MSAEHSNIIYQGSRGEAVSKLQAELGLKATGVFDADTSRAVRAFQTKCNLDADGVVGPAMWAAMERAKIVAQASPQKEQGQQKGKPDGRKKD